MTHQEAINIIRQATAQLSATLEVHNTIQQAIGLLEAERFKETPKPEVKT